MTETEVIGDPGTLGPKAIPDDPGETYAQVIKILTNKIAERDALLRKAIEVMIENSDFTEVKYMLENEREFIEEARAAIGVLNEA